MPDRAYYTGIGVASHGEVIANASATNGLSMRDLVPTRRSQRSDFSRWQDRLRQQASGIDMGHGNEIQLILQGAFDIESHELFSGRTQTPPNRGRWR